MPGDVRGRRVRTQASLARAAGQNGPKIWSRPRSESIACSTAARTLGLRGNASSSVPPARILMPTNPLLRHVKILVTRARSPYGLRIAPAQGKHVVLRGRSCPVRRGRTGRQHRPGLRNGPQAARPARAPKPSRPGPKRPPGRRNTRPTPRHDVHAPSAMQRTQKSTTPTPLPHRLLRTEAVRAQGRPPGP
jgi:hypothetical protein